MNVLLIGGQGSLRELLVNKLYKEGHRIYLLSGSKFNKEKNKKVFETYNFSYDSECMGEIFESIRPNVTLFLGAYDSNYSWVDERREAVRYISNLTNLLAAFTTADYGRFVYVSSGEVFSGDYRQDITEDTPVSPSGVRAMAIAQGEEVCDSYRTTQQLDIVTVRIDNLLRMAGGREEIHGVIPNQCLEALEKGVVTANVNHRFSVIFENDVTEYLYTIMSCHKHEFPLYHISSSDEISEKDSAELIMSCFDSKVQIEEVDRWKERNILSNKRYHDEFGMRIFNTVNVITRRLAQKMRQEPNLYLEAKKEELSWHKKLLNHSNWLIQTAVPFVENAICFIPFFMLNNRAVGSAYFSNLDFYLLYVLLFAIIYGQQQATVSAILAVGGYLFRQMYTRTSFEVLIDYNTYIWIAQLFILGLVVGYLRDQIKMLRNEKEEEQAYLNYQLSDITDINQSNVRVKDALENQIVNNNDSIGKIYSITSALDHYTAEEVLFYAAETVAKLMNSKDVAIYSVSNGDYARLASSTSPKARSLGNSIQYRKMEELSNALMEKRIFINQDLKEGYPLMAGGIYEGNEVQMMVMIWGISWEQMTLSQANLLTVVCYLIQNAVLHANRYMAALEDKRYHGESKVMEMESFRSLVQAFYHARDKELTECTLLEVELKGRDEEESAKILNKKLRQSDYLGTFENGKLYALLANTNYSAAAYVMKRFEEEGFGCSIKEDLNV